MPMTERDFWDAYDRLTQIGRCDGVGGMEYRRVLEERKEGGCPSNLDHFISVRANMGPSSTSGRADMN